MSATRPRAKRTPRDVEARFLYLTAHDMSPGVEVTIDMDGEIVTDRDQVVAFLDAWLPRDKVNLVKVSDIEPGATDTTWLIPVPRKTLFAIARAGSWSDSIDFWYETPRMAYQGVATIHAEWPDGAEIGD